MEQYPRSRHVCGKGIPCSDLEDQRALTLLRRRYCRTCTAALQSTVRRSAASAPSWRPFGGRRLVGLVTASASLLLLLYFLGTRWWRV